jgi:hypothetical protein
MVAKLHEFLLQTPNMANFLVAGPGLTGRPNVVCADRDGAGIIYSKQNPVS